MTVSCIDFITSKKQKIALRGIRVHSRLSGMAQQTTIEQTFINMEQKAIEVTYTFPVPERAAVCGFEVLTGDRVLTGQVEEGQKASEMYEAAVTRGDAAYGLRQHRPDVFSVDVGNINPGQITLVRITYVSELEVTDGRVRLAYPTVVAPRYATATATDPLQALIDAQTLNPPHVLDVPYGLSLVTEVALGRPVRSILSSSHAITVQPQRENEYGLELAQNNNGPFVTIAGFRRSANVRTSGLSLSFSKRATRFVAANCAPETGDTRLGWSVSASPSCQL